MKCPICEGPTTSKVEVQVFQYGDPPVDLGVQVPVYRCVPCAFEFTDEEGEEAKEAAVIKHVDEKGRA